MKQIRNGVFETNSSSTHSIVICTKEEYDKWGETTLLNEWGIGELPRFVTYKQAIKYLISQGYNISDYEEDELAELLDVSGFKSPDNFYSDELESFEEHFTTLGGEKIIVFGQYGEQR